MIRLCCRVLEENNESRINEIYRSKTRRSHSRLVRRSTACAQPIARVCTRENGRRECVELMDVFVVLRLHSQSHILNNNAGADGRKAKRTDTTKPVAAVIGASISGVSIQVANLLRLFGIVQVRE